MRWYCSAMNKYIFPSILLGDPLTCNLHAKTAYYILRFSVPRAWKRSSWTYIRLIPIFSEEKLILFFQSFNKIHFIKYRKIVLVCAERWGSPEKKCCSNSAAKENFGHRFGCFWLISHIGFWGQNVNVYILYCTFHLYVMCKKGFLVKKEMKEGDSRGSCLHKPSSNHFTEQSPCVLCTFLSTQNSNLLLNNLSKCYCIVLPSYFSSRVTNNFGVSWIMPSLIWTYLIINGFIFFSSFQPAFWIENSM